jgi:prevent-host-death family protein
VNLHEAEAALSDLIEAVAAGERVVIARDGEPVAVLAPYRVGVEKRALGLFPGQATVRADFDELPADLAVAMGAER